MPTTDLDIVNAACAMLAVEPLQSLDDELPGGKAVQLLYRPVVDFCMTLAPWSFARRTRQCSRIASETSALGFAFVHQLPSDRIGLPDRLIVEYGDRTGRTLQAFDYDDNGRVHSDAEIVWAQYTARVAPNLWHPAFVTAVIHAVAAAFAEPLTGNSGLQEALHAKAFGTPSESWRGGVMRAALQADSRATPARTLPAWSNPLRNAWGGGQ